MIKLIIGIIGFAIIAKIVYDTLTRV